MYSAYKLNKQGKLKSLLIKAKEESEKFGLKFNIHKTKIIASSPITLWQIDGETMETVRDFISGGSKVTADGDSSHEIKGRFLLGRKAMTNLDSMLKSRDITLPTKVRIIKAMVFPVAMVNGRVGRKESWALKNWCFWTVVLEKTPDSPLECKKMQPVYPKGNQSWISIGRTDAEAETLNTLATLCEELTHWKRPWCWERLKAGGEGDNRGWDGWVASVTQWTWVCVNSGSWWWMGKPGVLQSMESQRVRHDGTNELKKTGIFPHCLKPFFWPSRVLCPVFPESLIYVSNKSFPTLLVYMRYQGTSNLNFGWRSILCLQGDYNRKNDSCQRFI